MHEDLGLIPSTAKTEIKNIKDNQTKNDCLAQWTSFLETRGWMMVVQMMG